MHTENTNNLKKAYFYSFIFHGILIVLMFGINVSFRVERPEFFELELSGISQERIAQIIGESRRIETAKAIKQKTLSPAERIDIPTRKMVEIEEPTISIPAEKKMESREMVSKAEKIKMDISSPEMKYEINENSIFTMERKETFQGSKIDIGEEPGGGMETGPIGSDLNFEIQGEIKGREIISNPLPQYPQGLNKNAIIAIRITVLPDGSISSSGMLPVRKENTLLENLTMSKLKVWRFSPLPDGDNRLQTGIISFIFKVK